MAETLAELQARAASLAERAEREAERCTELSTERDELDQSLRELAAAERPSSDDGVLGTWLERGFEAAMWLPVLVPVAVAVGAVYSIFTSTDAPPRTELTGAVLDTTDAEVAVAARCTIVVVGRHKHGAACRGSIVCGGRRVFDGPLDCVQEHRVEGSGDDETSVYTLRATGTAPGVTVTIDVDDGVSTVGHERRALTIVHDGETSESEADE